MWPPEEGMNNFALVNNYMYPFILHVAIRVYDVNTDLTSDSSRRLFLPGVHDVINEPTALLPAREKVRWIEAIQRPTVAVLLVTRIPDSKIGRGTHRPRIGGTPSFDDTAW